MLDPQALATSIVGEITWEDPAAGLCRCPGDSLHTHPTKKRDCIIRIDGAPTIYCFHTSCSTAVADANNRLRSALGSEPWELRLPDGKVLRSGGRTPLSPVAQARRSASPAHRLADIEARAREALPRILEDFSWPTPTSATAHPFR